jgi:FkbM family methyltransferase
MSDPVPVFEFGKSDIKTSYCIDLDTRDRQVIESLARIPGRLQPSPDRDGKIAVVCYGPSLEETWEQVRHFDKIITVSGAHKFLIDKGIIPTWHAEVDPRPHKADLIGTPHKDVEYLCASVCHKAVFDLLEGFNVKLWHVFSHEAGREKIPVAFPRGDWAITGGSNVGLRALVIARFMGFKKVTLFGMDYSFKRDGSQHAGWHPKEHPNLYAVEVAGETYFTNPPMHQYAQQFFHEIAQLGDIELDVVGEGLLQAQIREHTKTKPLIPKEGKKGMLAATTPETITAEYAALNRKLHETDPAYGISGSKRADTVRKLIESTKPSTILDYGCGKGTLGAALDRPIWEYDPCVPGKDAPPRPADLVICTDVLEHVEPDRLTATLLDLSRCTLKVCYVVVNTGPAKKKLADGRNAHLIQKSMAWWKEQLSAFFAVASIQQEGVEVLAVLGPKPKDAKPVAVAPSIDASNRITPVRHDKTEVRFYTPNDTTQWRAQSLFTKEPATIEWIDTFKAGEVFFDIGANMGGYSVWAAKRRGVKVFAFEPMADNYALLCRNLRLNNVDGLAYCLALTDQTKLASIYLSSEIAGGACNSFGKSISPDLKERKGIEQGCIGRPLDVVVSDLGQPDHIKIDVDGLEHLVVNGAISTLFKVKSLLVEVNTNLPEHVEMVKLLQSYGLEFDPAQVESSTRKEGVFKGCAEYVFKRKQSAIVSLLYEGESKPFPWIYAESVFAPDSVHADIMANWPKDDEFQPIEQTRNVKGYPERFTADPQTPFWKDLFARMRDGQLKRRLCGLFGVPNPDDFTDECLLIQDRPGYQIGPHTDSPVKVITALFYLPTEEIPNAGTSIYTPKESGFTCKGGPHYESDKFDLVKTMPFKPNSMFAFLKTDNSFHGVEKCDAVRNVLLYDIRRKA